MLRLSIVFAFVLAFATCVLAAPTPVVTPAPAVVALEERDNNIEVRAAKKKTTTTKKKAAPTQKLYTSSASYSGKATWFTQDGNPGSCGKWNNGMFDLISLLTSVEGKSTDAFRPCFPSIVRQHSPRRSQQPYEGCMGQSMWPIRQRPQHEQRKVGPCHRRRR